MGKIEISNWIRYFFDIENILWQYLYDIVEWNSIHISNVYDLAWNSFNLFLTIMNS